MDIQEYEEKEQRLLQINGELEEMAKSEKIPKLSVVENLRKEAKEIAIELKEYMTELGITLQA